MSALDWGAGSGSNPTPRYYTAATPALPDSDWCAGGWVRKLAITGSSKQFLFCIGTAFGTDSVYAYMGETSFGYLLGTEAHNAAGTEWINAAQAGTPAQDGLDYLFISQRRSGTYEAYLVVEGSTVSAPNLSSAGVSGTFSASTVKLGYDSGVQLLNPFGEFFLFNNRSLSLAQITTLAAGARPNAANVGGDPIIMLPFRSGDIATEVNIGTGGATYNATRVSSGFTTTTDFFSLSNVPAAMHHRRQQGMS